MPDQPHHGSPRRRSPAGFSLVELLVVVTVVAILAAIAYPIYTSSVRKARRAEAIAALGALQQAQERHRSNHPTYAGHLDALPAPRPASPTTPGGHYTLILSDASASGYQATAKAIGGQAGDSACGELSVALDGGTLTQLPAACWAR